MNVQQRLSDAGLKLPTTFTRLGAYVPGYRDGSTIYVSGQTGTVDGRPVWAGQVGADLGLEEARASAGLSALNALGALNAVIGNLDAVTAIARTTVYVNAVKEFTQHPQVADAVTEILETAFGGAGRGARSAVGVASLPQGAPVELDLIAIIDTTALDV